MLFRSQEQDYTPQIRRPGFLSNYPAGRHGQNQKGEQQLMSKIYFVCGIKPSTKPKWKQPELPPCSPLYNFSSSSSDDEGGRRGGRRRWSGRGGVVSNYVYPRSRAVKIISEGKNCVLYPIKTARNDQDRKSTRLNSSHRSLSRMPSSA